MEKIIELCNNKLKYINYNGFAALESPTGTGKTLSLLCSLLAWANEMKMKNEKKFNGTIIYTSRTHSQITQVINELKKTIYKPKTAILSSREYSCINEGLKNFCKKASEKLDINKLNIICRQKRGICFYENSWDNNPEYLSENNLIDIEDLCIEGRQKSFCPFYYEKEKAKTNADLILMPYNYLFCEDIRNNLKLDFNNNIIIIDEAHNIRKICENEKSFEISKSDFNEINRELHYLLNKRNKLDQLNNKLKDISEDNADDDLYEDIFKAISKDISEDKLKGKFKKTKDELLISIEQKKIEDLISFVEQIENKISNISLDTIYSYKGKAIFFKELKYLIFSSLESKDKINDNDNTKAVILNALSLKKLRTCYESYKLKESKIILIIKLLSILLEFLNNSVIENSYCLYICNEQDNSNLAFNEERKIKVFCFNPEIAFNEIIKINPFALILTSGNLKPFDILEKEFNLKFDIIFENDHIINDDQIKFTIISSGEFNGQIKDSTFDYNNRDKEEMIVSLGKIILNLCRLKNNNGGILVFFPSYTFLNKCYRIWNKYRIDKEIENFKSITKDSNSIKLLSNKIIKSENKNFILLSVYRGSSSEGIDFSDDNGRMVICVGIPYANISDDKIKNKLEYMDKQKNNAYSRHQWYEADAMINVNQSLGIVIRNKEDYGVMICIDKRYSFNSITKLFPKWLSKI